MRIENSARELQRVKIFARQNTVRRNFHAERIPCNKKSKRRNFRASKLPAAKLWGTNFSGAKLPRTCIRARKVLVSCNIDAVNYYMSGSFPNFLPKLTPKRFIYHKELLQPLTFQFSLAFINNYITQLEISCKIYHTKMNKEENLNIWYTLKIAENTPI